MLASVAGQLVSVLVVLRNVNGTLAVFRADQSEMVWVEEARLTDYERTALDA